MACELNRPNALTLTKKIKSIQNKSSARVETEHTKAGYSLANCRHGKAACVLVRALAKITESFPKEISAPVEGPVSPASRDVGRALSCPRIAADQPKMQNSLTEQRVAYSLYPDKSDILQPCLEKSATSTPTARIRPKIRVFERLPSVSKAGKMLVAHAAAVGLMKDGIKASKAVACSSCAVKLFWFF